MGGGAQADGGASLVFPPGAVAGVVDITVAVTSGAPKDVAPPSGTEFIPVTVDITPSQETTLGEPVTLTINLSNEQLAGHPIATIGIARINHDGSIDVLPVEVLDAENGVVRVTIDHFTKYTIFAATSTSPVLQAPHTGVILTSLGTVLKWANPADTTWFQVQVVPFNKDGPGIDLVIGDPALVAAARYEVKPPRFDSADPNYLMLPGITYTWRVRTAKTATRPTETDWSAWSVSTFRTSPMGSGSLALQSPPDQSLVETNRPTLTWANSDREVFYYEVQVSKDPSFGQETFRYWELVHGGVTSPLNSYVIPEEFPLEPGATYYWRIRPRIQGDGEPVGWTAPWSFTTP